MSKTNSKNVDFEINLLPVISVLAVCICFLLLSAVWVHVGTIDTAQAIGAESKSGTNNPPSLIVQLDKNNSFDLQLKDIKTNQRRFMIQARAGEADFKRLDQALTALKSKYPDLNTSVVLNRPQVKYGHVIKTVDSLKKAQFKDVGVSPI
jgi:biopolymer transport protein TolR